jgi:hypothetical protein
MVTMQDLLVEYANHKWSFVTIYNGKRTLSPRRFATMGHALRAVCEKLAMHAMDGEYPTIGLICLEEHANE